MKKTPNERSLYKNGGKICKEEQWIIIKVYLCKFHDAVVTDTHKRQIWEYNLLCHHLFDWSIGCNLQRFLMCQQHSTYYLQVIQQQNLTSGILTIIEFTNLRMFGGKWHVDSIVGDLFMFRNDNLLSEKLRKDNI